jgi:hypothetical protein
LRTNPLIPARSCFCRVVDSISMPVPALYFELYARARSRLTFDEVRNRIQGPKIIKVKIFVLDDNTELTLNEEYQLHSKERVDKTEGENVLVVLQFDVLKKLGDKRLYLRAYVFHSPVLPPYTC